MMEKSKKQLSPLCLLAGKLFANHSQNTTSFSHW